MSSSFSTQIEEAVKRFKNERNEFERFAKVLHDELAESKLLTPLIHSSKYRAKDVEHLRDKLRRKAAEAEAKGKQFKITEGNLFSEIDDLAGVRLIHLHTKQMAAIDIAIRSVLNEALYKVIEGPIANIWDDENRGYFASLGMKTIAKDTMYTSVHYIVEQAALSRRRCELQVRTLMEEVWGEVSHKIDYPQKTSSIACSEQLKVLARIASGGSRLVDSIFASHDDHLSRVAKSPLKSAQTVPATSGARRPSPEFEKSIVPTVTTKSIVPAPLKVQTKAAVRLPLKTSPARTTLKTTAKTAVPLKASKHSALPGARKSNAPLTFKTRGKH